MATSSRSAWVTVRREDGVDGTLPLPTRLYGWLDERFPPVVYTVLVLLFYGSAVAVAVTSGGGGELAPLAAPVVWLSFLHLRIFDEHKDFANDVAAYPQRLLSRGVVTLPLLARVGLVAIACEAVLAGLLGPRAFVAWAAAAAFSVAMRFEFGVGPWLERHLVAYAITHNPIVALLAVFLHAATGAAWSWAFVAYVAVVSAGSLGFEIGRKTRRADEEHTGVPSYTTHLGQGRARGLLAAVHAATAVSVALTLSALHAGFATAVFVAALAAAPGLATVGSRAKVVEAGASATLLCSLLACGVAAAVAS
jgi:hypothetical protein